MIAKIKFIFLYSVFYTSFVVIKRMLELCMWFEVDNLENVHVGKIHVDGDFIDTLAQLHMKLNT